MLISWLSLAAIVHVNSTATQCSFPADASLLVEAHLQEGPWPGLSQHFIGSNIGQVHDVQSVLDLQCIDCIGTVFWSSVLGLTAVGGLA